MISGLSSAIKDHLAGGASRLTSLLLPQILAVFSVVAPRQPGAALRDLVLVRRGQATRIPPILLVADRRRSRATQAGMLALGLVAARLVDPNRPVPFDVCAFNYLTGFPCPTCGLTRALCHALRGDWAASVSHHPAGLLLAAALIGWMLWAAAEAARGHLVADLLRRRVSDTLLASGAALSLLAWILRILTT